MPASTPVVRAAAARRRPRRATAIIPLATLATAGAAAIAGDCGTGPITDFRLEGQAAPDTGESFQTFDRPNIGAGGHVAFAGDTDGPFGADDVVYVDDRLVAREGTPAPGVAGAAYGGFEFFETGQQVNAGGQAVYITSLTGVPTDQNRALYFEDTLVIQEGQEVPGIPGRLVVDLGFAGVTDDGRVGYLADLDGPSEDDSVIVLGGTVLFREGDPAPGFPGVTFDGDFDEVSWNGAGDVLFEANTSLPGAEDQVVYLRRVIDGSVSVETVAREGQMIAASGGTDFLELILQTTLAEDGAWAVRGNLGVAPSTSDAIILASTGVQLQQGAAITELPGAVLGNFNGVDINRDGVLLVLADIEGTVPNGVDEGLFLDGCLLVTDGTPAPGVPDGAMLTDIGFEDAWINDAGQIVFAASYSGGDGLFRVDALAPVPCLGDLDGDRIVGFTDLTLALSVFGDCPAKGPCPADFDDDGMVGFTDLTLILANWGTCSPG